MDEVTVKEMTRQLSKRERPSAEENWKKYSKADVTRKWPIIWKTFTKSVLTPRDFATHLKFLHRGLNFKNHHDTRYTDKTCRLCQAAEESEAHCNNCHALQHTWYKLAGICEKGGDKVDATAEEFTLFGLTKEGFTLKPMHQALHKLVWKFIWTNMNSETVGNGKPKPNTIIECALKRLEKKIIAFHADMELRKQKQEGMSLGFKIGKGVMKKLTPWIELDEQGVIKGYSKEYMQLSREYGLNKPKEPQPVLKDAPRLYPDR